MRFGKPFFSNLLDAQTNTATVKTEVTAHSISRHLTAIHRSELSRPIRLALKDGIIGIDDDVLDYGCGHGDDLERLAALGIACSGWDPTHRPDGERAPSAVVNLGYVVNVIENPEERTQVLRDSWALAQSMLIVSARLQHELRGSC
jgi:DNA phosphorothioation-associated putative methyltransferase